MFFMQSTCNIEELTDVIIIKPENSRYMLHIAFREVEPSRQGSYLGYFSAITQPNLNLLTQFLERDEIRIVSSHV